MYVYLICNYNMCIVHRFHTQSIWYTYHSSVAVAGNMHCVEILTISDKACAGKV